MAITAQLFIWRESGVRAQPSRITAGLARQRIPGGNRMGDRIGEDGSPMDPATIRALKWAALNWATHCSFSLYSSSLPRQQNFVFPDSSRVDSVGPELEQKERQKLRRSSRKRKRVRPESVAMARGGESAAGNRITEKKVIPVVPQHPGDFEMLRCDLATMQCEELLYRNWDIQDTGILAEVQGKPVPSVFRENRIRGKRTNWTWEHWSHAYSLPDCEYGLESGQKGDSEWVKGRFSEISEKDGFRVVGKENGTA